MGAAWKVAENLKIGYWEKIDGKMAGICLTFVVT